MDPNGHIYMDENVPPEDKARLDGFLRGRAEGDEKARAELEEAREEFEREAKRAATEGGD